MDGKAKNYENIDSPLRYYADRAKSAHQDYVNRYFENLKQRAQVNEEENARTVKEYDKRQAEISVQQTQISAFRKQRGWGIFGLIVLAIALMVIFGVMNLPPPLLAVLCALTVVGLVTSIVLLCKKTGAKIKSLQTTVAKLQKEADILKDEALLQVLPILKLFTDFDGLSLVEQVFPHITFDGFCSADRLKELELYGYNPSMPSKQCVVDVLTGALYGSPLLYERRMSQEMGTKTYYGSLYITWDETYTDSQGETRTRTRGETLRASVTKVAPYYYDEVKLYYGQDVKPELSFSRVGKDSHRKSEKALERTLRSGEKKLQRKHDKELKKGGDFTPLVNTEFEVLFGATDRTDELAFRYLFTVKAQENMLQLIRSGEGYGDDFDFYKYGKLNTIVSDHAQYNSLFPKVGQYVSHDFKEIEKKFKETNQNFFKSLFFDIAPFIAIPCYQQPTLASKKIETGGYSNHTYQIMARLLGDKTQPNGVETNVIYDARVSEKQDGADIVSVHSSGYYTEERTDYVSVHGGDGHWHNVPVQWQEYLPIEKYSKIKVWDLEKGEGEVSHLGVTASFLS